MLPLSWTVLKTDCRSVRRELMYLLAVIHFFVEGPLSIIGVRSATIGKLLSRMTTGPIRVAKK